MLDMKKLFSSGFSWLWIAILVLALDRYSKVWMLAHLTLFESVKILSVFNFTLAFNKGAAFSFLNSASGWQNILLGALAVGICMFIFCWLYKSTAKQYWLNIALCLIIGGALGNVWDRILYGYVIDFFDFHWDRYHFAIFNVADAAICVGTFMLLFHWIVLDRE